MFVYFGNVGPGLLGLNLPVDFYANFQNFLKAIRKLFIYGDLGSIKSIYFYKIINAQEIGRKFLIRWFDFHKSDNFRRGNIWRELINPGEWPSGLRHCNQNQKVPCSKPTRHLARLRDPTLLWGFRWPLVQTCTNAVINIGLVTLSPWEWPKVGCGTAK